jgi:hypothetical protein
MKKILFTSLCIIILASCGQQYIRHTNRVISDVYVHGNCKVDSYCYGEDSDGNEIEFHAYEMSGGRGYGEDNDGNEIEFYYD